MVTVSHVSKAYGPQELFRGATFRLLPGDRLGLVGPNGSGKTTLFNIILGEVEPDEGLVESEGNPCFGFLPQESAPTGEETVLQLACAIDPEMRRIYADLREYPDPRAEEHAAATTRFIEREGHRLEAKARRILAGLAFPEAAVDAPARQLSGGWIMRAHLAKLLVMEPDVLMLDEPTNHLDLETLGWFQEQLRQYRGAILTISHDRAFLNAVCEGMLEIDHRRVYRYPGNYNRFLVERKRRKEQHRAAYENQQREIAQIEDFINRFRAKATKASQAQSRVKQLERMERIEAPEPESASTIHFRFPQPPRSGQRVITLEKVEQAYGNHRVYRDLDFTLERGERVVLVGPNGAGKSTLLKILAGLVPINAGRREPGLNVSIGYFSQQRIETLDPEATVLEEALARRPDGMTEEQVRTLLGAFLLTGDYVFKKVKVLSGGEKSRLSMVKLLLHPPNLLLLDEPTTHFDMGSVDALLGALSGYSGTLVFVSHDVHFIRSLADKVVRIEAGRITPYAGGYDYYLRKSGVDTAAGGLIAGSGPAVAGASATVPGPKPKGPTGAERRRQKAEIRECEREIQRHEARILELEAEQESISQRFAETVGETAVRELQFEAARVEEALAEENRRWETAIERLNKLKQ